MYFLEHGHACGSQEAEFFYLGHLSVQGDEKERNLNAYAALRAAPTSIFLSPPFAPCCPMFLANFL